MLTTEQFTKICGGATALLPRYAPDFKNPAIVEFWYQEFGNDPNFQKALHKAVTTLESFPTIAKIRELLGKGEVPNDKKAIDASDRIINAVEKYGSYRWSDAKQYMGELGWQIVQNNGGWENVCEVTYKELPIVKAQYRESAKALLEKAKFGDINAPPKLPVSNDTKQIVSDALKIAGGTNEKS